MQRHAQEVVTDRIGADDPSGVAATFTAVEPGSGQVKALVVNRRYGETGQGGSTKVNLAVGGSSGMQAGSTFKPFVLAAAVEQGLPLDTTVDAPATYTSTVFQDCDGGCKPYTVSNAATPTPGATTSSAPPTARSTPPTSSCSSAPVSSDRSPSRSRWGSGSSGPVRRRLRCTAAARSSSAPTR
jgi:hypothetical protein